MQYHKRMKHFDVKHHYIWEKVNDQSITIEYCPTKEMTANIFTKPLPKPKFQKHKAELGIAWAQSRGSVGTASVSIIQALSEMWNE